MTELVDAVVEMTGATMPEGYDAWAVKSIHADGTTHGGFQWPPVGGEVSSDERIDADNSGPCPKHPGDGLCVAWSWEGMASGGIPSTRMLLVAYNSALVLGESNGKARVAGSVRVVAELAGADVARHLGQDAHLRGADLQGADLRGADLRYAYLQGADLRYADLQGADLRYALLRGAYLQGADLQGADLQDAHLQGADLQDAHLQGARNVPTHATAKNA